MQMLQLRQIEKGKPTVAWLLLLACYFSSLGILATIITIIE